MGDARVPLSHKPGAAFELIKTTSISADSVFMYAISSLGK